MINGAISSTQGFITLILCQNNASMNNGYMVPPLTLISFSLYSQT
jgi:hypothetical protein